MNRQRVRHEEFYAVLNMSHCGRGSPHLMLSLDGGIFALNKQKLRCIFATFHAHFLIPPNQVTSLSFMNTHQIRALNKKYRNKSRATDVLSFRYPSSRQADAPELFGQIFICPSIVLQRIRLQQRLCRMARRRLLVLCRLRVLRLLAHAFCHLAGYDHETRPEYLQMIKHENRLIGKTCKHCDIFGDDFLRACS